MTRGNRKGNVFGAESTQGGMETTDAESRLAELVRERREAAAMTQEDVAVALKRAGHNASQSTIWAMETGRQRIKFGVAVSLASILSIDLNGLREDSSAESDLDRLTRLTLEASRLAARVRDA